MATVLTNNQNYIDIANAIRAKGVSGTFYPSQMANAIQNISSGGRMPENGVVFIDYDGSIVESWDSSSVASKTSLPANPTHAGLVGEGWNWSLTNIKSYVSAYPNAKVAVGQMYHTVSGLTEMDITVTKATGLTVTCKMVGNKKWGDGTENSSTTHTYADYGDYTITCNGTTIPAGTSSASGLFGSDGNLHICTAIRIGGNVTSIGRYAFSYCCSLAIITIPNGVTSIGDEAFSGCFSLTEITIPNGVTSIGSNAFSDCVSLTTVIIPNGFTSISSYAFYSCFSLTTITIPNGVTSIGYFAFSDCYSLTTITIPNSVTSIGNSTFSFCYHLTAITIPNGVTSIDESTFRNCYSLTTITIPSSVTSIGTYAFSDCYAITEYNFTGLTAIPTLSSSSAFIDINGICKILVPSSLYNNWIVANNWATYADYIYAV